MIICDPYQILQLCTVIYQIKDLFISYTQNPIVLVIGQIVISIIGIGIGPNFFISTSKVIRQFASQVITRSNTDAFIHQFQVFAYV